MDAIFSWHGGSQNEVFTNFSESLLAHVKQMNLDFKDLRYWRKPLCFEVLCVRLQKRCPQLHTLTLHFVKLSLSLKSAIDLCSKFLPKVEVLAFRFSEITDCYKKRKYDGLSKIKVLDLCKCIYIREFHDPVFPKMPYLEILNLAYSTADDYWIQGDTSFLSRLKILNASGTLIHCRTFGILQSHASNLTELYLCRTFVKNADFQFNNSVFPQLKTICLRGCVRITSEGIVFLTQSCQSLENIYVDEEIAESYANHPLVIFKRCKLDIVKTIHHCRHYCKIDYLYE